MRSRVIDAPCAHCGTRVAALAVGAAPPLCETCGRHASHVSTNGTPNENASNDATLESSPLEAPG